MTSLLHNYDILTEETVLITETPKHTAFVGINVSQRTDTQYLLCLFPRLLKLLVKQMAPEEVYISSVPNVKEGEGEEQRIKKSQRLVLPQKKKTKKRKTADHDAARGMLKDNVVHLISNQIQVSGAGLRNQT